ncbi:MAG TPA: putative lipid II flippase FtsW [Verrucomicrobia bacterium]|nr:putative lipid II flippase FtsW [Verrucomicrobiota bacterium]
MKLAVTLLICSVAALLALGMVMLYSSSMTQDGARYLLMQLLWGAIGLVLFVMVSMVDYRILKPLALPLFLLAAALLVLVLVPEIGHKANGARRWFNFGGVRFQPSELGKIALIVLLAWYGERYQRHMHTFKRGVFIPGIFIAVVLGLIFVEPDRGTTVLLAAVACGVLLVAGVRWKYFVPPMVMGVVGLAVSLWHDPMRMRRILSWLDLEQHKEGAGFQAYQAMLALGAGGWRGLGLGNGRQKLFVPEQHTDFILSIIGEELGLIATLLILLGFVVIACCGIFIAGRARDTFGMLLASGITLLISLQALINVGVVTSALPNKGLPLPFISYGGSNLLAMLTCVGLLVSIARHARIADDAITRSEAREARTA